MILLILLLGVTKNVSHAKIGLPSGFGSKFPTTDAAGLYESPPGAKIQAEKFHTDEIVQERSVHAFAFLIGCLSHAANKPQPISGTVTIAVDLRHQNGMFSS